MDRDVRMESEGFADDAPIYKQINPLPNRSTPLPTSPEPATGDDDDAGASKGKGKISEIDLGASEEEQEDDDEEEDEVSAGLSLVLNALTDLLYWYQSDDEERDKPKRKKVRPPLRSSSNGINLLTSRLHSLLERTEEKAWWESLS